MGLPDGYAVLFIPYDLYAFGKSLIATTFFASNVHFSWHAHPLGYFDARSSSEMLLHSWSQSVEEQYYLLFPTFILILYRLGEVAHKVMFMLNCGNLFCINIGTIYHKPIAAFYLFFPRAWELLIGALLAAKALPEIQSRAIREAIGIVGIGRTVVGTFILTESTPFPGFATLLPCVGAWLIIYGGEHGKSDNKDSTLLPSSRIYTCDLIFTVSVALAFSGHHTEYFIAGRLSALETVLVLVWSLTMAFLSFEFVERPFRGVKSKFNRRQVFAFGLTASVSFVVIGGIFFVNRGLPRRYDQHTVKQITDNMARGSDYVEPCGNWQADVHSITDIKFCEFGKKWPRKIMFWGDSHVGQLYPVIQEMYQEGDFKNDGILMAIADGCSPAQVLNTVGGNHCGSFSRFAMMRAEENDVKTVFIGFNTNWSFHNNVRCEVVNGRCKRLLSTKETERIFLEDLSNNIRTLRGRGKRVIVCLPFPMYDKSIADLEMREAVFGKFGLSWTATDLTSQALGAQFRSIAASSGADVFDPRMSLCRENTCTIKVNGASIYKDNNRSCRKYREYFEGKPGAGIQRTSKGI